MNSITRKDGIRNIGIINNLVNHQLKINKRKAFNMVR